MTTHTLAPAAAPSAPDPAPIHSGRCACCGARPATPSMWPALDRAGEIRDELDAAARARRAAGEPGWGSLLRPIRCEHAARTAKPVKLRSRTRPGRYSRADS